MANLLDRLFRSKPRNRETMHEREDAALRREMYKAAMAELEPLTSELHKTQSLKSALFFDGYMLEGMPVVHPEKLAREQGVEIFRNMVRRDDMIASGSGYVSFATVAPGHDIVPADPSHGPDVMAADWQKKNFDHIRGTTNQLLLNMIDAMFIGFSGAEILWDDPILEGEWRGKIPYSQVKHKSQKYLGFEADSYGDVLDEGIMQFSYDAGGEMYNRMPLKDFLYYAYRPFDDNPYGSSLLYPAYPYYVFKSLVLKSWGRVCDRFGLPIVVGKADYDTTKKGERTRFLSYLKQLHQNLASVIPNGLEVDIKEPKTKDAGDMFDSAMVMANRAEARCCLLPSLVLEQGPTGSRAQTIDQSGTQFGWVMGHIHGDIDDTMTQQLIRKNHDLNFGPTVGCPKFQMNSHDKEDLLKKAQLYKLLSEIGVTFGEDATRSAFGVESPSSEDIIIGGRQFNGQISTPGMEPEDRNTLFYMVNDAVEGKLKQPVTYSFPQLPEKCEHGHKDLHAAAKAKTKLEKLFDHDTINTEEADAIDHWSAIGGITLADIAGELEEREGK